MHLTRLLHFLPSFHLVLHDTSKPTTEILNGYPRGKKELTGLLSSRFSPQQAQSWFERQGVALKTEPDGRMFPITDSSQTVIDALTDAASKGGVQVRKNQKVVEVHVTSHNDEGTTSRNDSKFRISTQVKDKQTNSKQMKEEAFDAIILATGSAPAGYHLAQSILEQSASKKDFFVSPVPSLFTLNTKLDIKEEGCLLYGLAGVSVPKAHVTFQPEETKDSTNNNDDDKGQDAPATKKRKRPKKPPAHLQQEGPLLVTHHGVSGPSVLRLSAFGAREFHESNYRGTLRIHWAPDLGNVEDISQALWKMTQSNPKRRIVTGCPLTVTSTVKDSSACSSSQFDDDHDDAIHGHDNNNKRNNDINDNVKERGFVEKTMAAIPKRLWYSLVTNACGIPDTTTWADANKKSIRKLSTLMAECDVQVTGKGTFKDEFVTAGGVALKEIDMKTMMSKSCSGFFLCGEVINVDGVTGGYNFMNCWGTGHVAGSSAVDFVLGEDATK